MRIILSRKGFDSAAGGCASPILINEGNEIISLPIPGDINEELAFSHVNYNKHSLKKFIDDLVPQNKRFGKKPALANSKVHLDPWIDDRLIVKGQKKNLMAFGPNASLPVVMKDVKAGDLFLFFGWFRNVIQKNYRYIYEKNSPDLHVIWGYLQVGEIHLDPLNHPSNLKDHPHWQNSPILTPSKKLTSLGLNKPGSGVFGSLSRKRILTFDGEHRRSYWDLTKYPFLKNAKNNATDLDKYFKKGRWQELIIDIGDDQGFRDSLKEIFSN